jgi:hypothetical protein
MCSIFRIKIMYLPTVSARLCKTGDGLAANVGRSLIVIGARTRAACAGSGGFVPCDWNCAAGNYYAGPIRAGADDGRLLPSRASQTAAGGVNSMKKDAIESTSPSRLIDARIRELDDWRGETLSRVRALIKQADPEVVEEWKWRGVPVWSHDGLICTGETYKKVVKLTFAKGASLKDPCGLFNSSLEGRVRRAIDIHEGDELHEDNFKALIRAAAALNSSSAR